MSEQSSSTRKSHLHTSVAVLFLSVLVLPGTLRAEPATYSKDPTPITETFAAHDPDSTIELNHDMWSRFLSRTVVYSGYSTRRLGRGQKRTWVGSNMAYGNDLPSRYENNRVVLSGFDDEHLAAIRRYRQALESAAVQLPLARLNREEQLAYWLNLYNVHALEHVAAHYPKTTARALRNAPGSASKGVWHERTLNVAGTPLSLVDIEQEILFPIWDEPLILYGLWQGTIGGPRLPLQAYTGAGVWQALRENAREFINSNRGMEPDGEVLEVSLLYGWGAPLFDGHDDLRRHIEAHALPPFSDGLETTRRVEVDRYDWHLADLSGGTHHQGQWNNTAAFVSAVENSARGQRLADYAMRLDTTRRSMPPQTIELLENMDRLNNRERRTRVTVKDCPPERECAAGPEDDESTATPPETDQPSDSAV